MLNIPSDVKALFKLDSCRKNFHVHFPNGEFSDLNNEDVAQESVQFTESVCSQNTFKFGLSESSQIEFETVGIGNMVGAKVECGIEIDCTSLGASWAAAHPVDTTLPFLDPQTVYVESGEKKLFYRVPYGQFVVRSCPRDHKTITHRKVTAYTDTRFVDTPVQRKLMAARSVKAEYTPSFYRLLYSMSAYKNEKFLLDNNCVKTSKGAFSDAYETTYQKNSTFRIGSGVSDMRYAEFSVVRATKLFSDQQVTLIPKLSKDHIYGIIGINKIKTGDLLDKIASILVNQYSIPESEAFNSAKYPMDVTVPRSMRFTTDTNLSGVTITNDFVDLSRETEFVCFSPDREDISTHIFITKSVTVKLRTDPSGEPYATFTVNDITGLGDCSLYQYDMPQGIISADFDLILTPSGTETVESGTLNIFSSAINMSELIKGYYEASAEFSAPGRGYERRLFRLSETAVDTLLPDQYADFWMDEYNVSPIGKIKYMVMENGQQNELTYDFADGRSVYNMSGNAVFDRMNKKKSEVEAYLDTYFIPYLSAVMFDPVQITIGNGLPYLEAGDRIEATTEDNVTAKTYIMSQRISGIQHLVHEVESSGGGLLSVTEEGGMADE